MIYLLKSIEGNHTYIKIGYLEEWKPYYETFKKSDSNPKLLCLMEGNKVDVLALHRFFKDYWYAGGYGWFKYCNNIIDFFRNNNTIDKIRKAIPPVEVPKTKKKEEEKKS